MRRLLPLLSGLIKIIFGIPLAVAGIPIGAVVGLGAGSIRGAANSLPKMITISNVTSVSTGRPPSQIPRDIFVGAASGFYDGAIKGAKIGWSIPQQF